MIGNASIATFLATGDNMYILNDRFENDKGIGIIPIG